MQRSGAALLVDSVTVVSDDANAESVFMFPERKKKKLKDRGRVKKTNATD